MVVLHLARKDPHRSGSAMGFITGRCSIQEDPLHSLADPHDGDGQVFQVQTGTR